MKNVVLLSPYKSNKNVIDYLNACGIGVVRDVAMGLEARNFGQVTPQQWTELAKKNDRADPDGIFERLVGKAARQQQPGRPVGLREEAAGNALAARADAAAWAADAAFELAPSAGGLGLKA
jgi:maleate cis-trans isomerase